MLRVFSSAPALPFLAPLKILILSFLIEINLFYDPKVSVANFQGKKIGRIESLHWTDVVVFIYFIF